MRVTVLKDNGEEEVFQNLTEVYLAYRLMKPMANLADNEIVRVPYSHSHSWGGDLRELVKEVTQSLVELQDFLREQRNGGSS